VADPLADSLTILHVDMDAFFASVEVLRRPDLEGRPVVVGGDGHRGVVASASYEARAHGVRSAMPSGQARRLCPDLVFLPADHRHYGEISRRVMDIFRSFTPLVEPLSLDEAFLDIAGARHLFGTGPEIAVLVRERVRDEEGLDCSVGVATTKFLAKLASDDAKPRPSLDGPRPGLGVKVVEPGDELGYLHPLQVGRLWGVGPKTRERLERLGVTTVGDLAALPLSTLTHTLGEAVGQHLHDLANARDERGVEPDQQLKSVGHEETFPVDLSDRAAVVSELVRLADSVASRLRRAGLAGRTVNLKVRFADFRTVTRSVTVTESVDTGPDIVGAARPALDQIDLAAGIRLLGVSVSGLSDGSIRQLSFDGVDTSGWSEASTALDRIRDRFGDEAIGPGAEGGGGR
jgi:DNA polymerase-4